MDNLEPDPGFYDRNGYGDYEYKLIYHGTVSMLNFTFIIVKLSNLVNIIFLYIFII